MKKYNITAILPSGDEVRAKVVAANPTAAIDRMLGNEQFKQFIRDAPIKEIKFYSDGDEEIMPIDIDACQLTMYEGVGCAVEHVATGVILGFEEGRFNETAEVLTYPAMMTPEKVAEIMREVGEWLYCFHRSKVFNLREVVQHYLKERGITKRALAMEIGITEQSLINYLKGDRGLPYEYTENLLVILRQTGVL